MPDNRPRVMVYAGSFDPPTRGHEWMIRSGARLCDRLIAAIGINPAKRCMFSVDERLAMLRELTANLPNVEVTSFGNQFLMDFAAEAGANFILRGLRNELDFRYELGMCNVNADAFPDTDIGTIFLVTPRQFAEISSSTVKALIGPEGWQDKLRRCGYVPESVYWRLRATAEYQQYLPDWLNLWQRLGGNNGTVSPAGGGEGIWREIIDHYNGRCGGLVREYHNFSHIDACLAEFEAVADLAQDELAVELALWLHDFEYFLATTPGECEQLSAEMVGHILVGFTNQPPEFIHKVERLILATTHQGPVADPDARLVADIDLAILGQPPEVFDRYEAGIRAEYSAATDEQFAAGRSAFIRTFLARPRIYQTDLFAARYEEAARANLRRSLDKWSV